MLSEKTLQGAFALANAAQVNKRQLTPVPESALGQAVASTLTEFQVLNDTNLDGRAGSASGIIEMLKECTNLPDGAGRYIHDEAMDALVAMIAPAVQRNFFLAKRAVVPAANAAYEAYKAQADAVDAQGVSDYAVKEVNLSAWWNNASFAQMVSRWDGVAVRPVALKILGINFTPETAGNYIKTGIASFDEAATTVSAETIASVLNSAFGTNPVGQLSQVLTQNLEAIDANAIVFLGAKYLLDNIPEGLNISGDEYKAYMSEVMAQAGRAVSQTFAKLEQWRRSKQFFLRSEGTSAVVESTGWKQYCSNGGDTEVLFGNMMSDKMYMPDNMTAKANQYREAYASYVRTSSAKFVSLRLEGLRAAMVTSVAEAAGKLLSEPTEADLVALTARIDAEARTFQSVAYDNAYLSIRQLIANAMYPNTDILKILALYDECEPQVVSKEPREIAALALIYYVADWLSDQVNVSTFSFPPEI